MNPVGIFMKMEHQLLHIASSGWTIYPPLSALPEAIPGSGTGMTLWLLSITIFVVGSLLGGLNYIVTILNLRTKGMSMQRMPLTCWALFVTAILGVLSFPVLLSAAFCKSIQRASQLGICTPLKPNPAAHLQIPSNVLNGG